MPSAKSKVLGACPFSINARAPTHLILCRPLASKRTAVSSWVWWLCHIQTADSQQSPMTSDSYTSSVTTPLVSLSLGEGCDKDVPVMAEHPTATSYCTLTTFESQYSLLPTTHRSFSDEAWNLHYRHKLTACNNRMLRRRWFYEILVDRVHLKRKGVAFMNITDAYI